MYNTQKKGTDAYYVAEGMVKALNDVEAAAEEALDTISALQDDLDDKEDEVSNLEETIRNLEERLTTAPNLDMEFLRVLRNINVYVCDSIRILEAQCGSKVEEEETPEHGGEQPPER